MLSASSASSITQHTNELSAPRSIRSVSSLSANFPTVQHNRTTSLDLGSASHSLSASASTSNLLYPRNSILINSRKRPYKGVIYGNPLSAAPVVTHIPAVPSRKEREKEKEHLRDKERERERERAKNKDKDDDTFWGIPKKAFLLGLGDLNFNAQMSMVAGWSHTSSITSLPPVYPTPSTDRKRARSSFSSEPPRSAPASISSQRSNRSSSDSDEEAAAATKSRGGLRRKCSDASAASADAKRSQKSGDSPPADEPMDPEELAALNAIINTRRSMAAAQALVSGTIAVPAHPLRGSSFGSSSQDVSRPQLDGKRFESQDSVPSMGHSSVMSVGSSELPTSPQPHGLVGASGSTILEPAEVKSPRIRFAPLPTPSSTPATLAAGGAAANALVEQLDDSDASDSDYESGDEAKSIKGKWYLMGISPAIFKPQSYTIKTSRRRKSNGSLSGNGDPDESSTTDVNAIGFRRRSTGVLVDGFSADAAQRAASENDEEERGRAAVVKNRRKSSQSTRRSRSRTGAISSGDEDERARKRELIRMARPGGTGMVTLPDGTKIRARRVNDQPSQDEPEFIEWGFAGLAREASRRSLGGSGPPSLATTPNSSDHKGLAAYMEAEQDEEDDGSGMAWVRRRRREREAKARLEREQAEKAAQEAANDPAQAETATQVTTPSTADEVNTAAQATSEAAAASTSTVDTAETAVPAPAITDEPMQLSTDTLAEPQTEAMLVSVPASVNRSRRSTLTPIDIARARSMSQDTEKLTASPVAEKPHTASLDASVFGEGDPIDMPEGMQRVARSRSVSEAHAAGDSTPHQNTGLGLTADKLEEIRRRHEDEVAALGAEVLAQTRRNQRRQASSSGRPLTSPLTGEESGNEQLTTSPVRNARTSQPPMPIMASSSMLAKSTSRDSAHEKRSLSRAVGSIMRKNLMDSDKPVRHSNIAPFVSSDERRKRQESWPAQAPVQEAVESKLHKEANTTAPATAAAASSGSRAVSNPLTVRTSMESQHSSKSSTVGYSTSMASKSVASLHSGGGSHTHSPIGTKRISLDPSVSTPAPSPWLPRRPDARGVSVVPLPQLGVRPERPREGRVWQYDDSDASEGSKSDEEEEEGSDLDAEELLEEERKTAMQKKRATTRAAGQEIVHARLGQKASARALSDLTASYDDMALSAMARQEKVEQRSGRPKRRSTADPRIASKSSRTPSAPRKAPPKLVRSNKSTSSVRSADEEAEDEEKDLWPAMSATSKSGTPRPRHILVNLPGGAGIWDSKTGGGRNAVAAINTVAAARAKAIKKRAKDRRTSFELPPNWDDEMMDYGWPRSLKGSLY